MWNLLYLHMIIKHLRYEYSTTTKDWLIFVGMEKQSQPKTAYCEGSSPDRLVADMLVKQGYRLYYFNGNNPALEMDFFIRDANSLIPIEVKANDGATASLNKLIISDKYPDVKYGIKLGYKNIGFNGRFYTFPYYLTFLLKRFVRERHTL